MSNTVIIEHQLSPSTLFQLVQGDITQEVVDAIVNAANSALQHGGGVASVISHAGGPTIQQESDAWVAKHGPASHTEPAYTSAGNLPCKYVIHAVGPIQGSGDEADKLADAVRGSLALADKLELQSITLPAISCGIYRFPKEAASRIIIQSIQKYFARQAESKLTNIRLIIYDDPTTAIFQKAWEAVFQ